MFFSQQSFADAELFKVYKQCHDELEFRCDVIREVNGEKNIIYKEMKSPMIKRLNQAYYHVKISCGSPCQGHDFIARDKDKDDFTQEFIAVDAKNNCLIETDTEKNKIIARQLNTSKIYTLISTKNQIFQQVPIREIAQYTIFQRSSYFDQNGNLVLLADYEAESGGKSQFKRVFPNPCKL